MPVFSSYPPALSFLLKLYMTSRQFLQPAGHIFLCSGSDPHSCGGKKERMLMGEKEKSPSGLS
jgi:hypothetical protein